MKRSKEHFKQGKEMNVEKLKCDWIENVLQGEPIEVVSVGDSVCGAYYGFTTELGALRLFHYYKGNKCEIIHNVFNRSISSQPFRFRLRVGNYAE